MTYRSIVVGSDGSATARGAVAEAAGLAKAFNAPLHLVSAYRAAASASAMAATAGMGVAVPTVAFGWGLATRRKVEAELGDLAGSLRADGVRVETHAVPGDPATAIVDIAEATGSDLVVVGSRGMTGTRRVLGSVPNTVAHRAGCAVLVVKTC
jgi:nucleotide-binding universal stress UspA family protein